MGSLAAQPAPGVSGRRHGPSSSMLALEFAVLFVAIPVGYRFSPVSFPPLPLLWAAALYCYWRLSRDPGFHPKCLWNSRAMRGQLVQVFSLFVLCGGTIALGIWKLRPQLLFSLVRHHPALWAMVMVFYPVLSVYPQSLVFRAFLMHRYAGWARRFGPEGRKWVLVALSAAAFSLMHIIFRNWISVGLTLVGGVFFAWRYYRTQSLALSMLEHSLYGCLLFTAGLGDSFYIGPHRLQ